MVAECFQKLTLVLLVRVESLCILAVMTGTVLNSVAKVAVFHQFVFENYCFLLILNPIYHLLELSKVDCLKIYIVVHGIELISEVFKVCLQLLLLCDLFKYILVEAEPLLI